VARAHDDDDDEILPSEAIDRLLAPLARFLHVEAAGGIVLLVASLLALALANSPWADAFLAFWKTPVRLGVGGFEMSHSLKHWVSDGAMSIFFFVVGLEVKRELVIGELRDPRRAALPIAAALGGMLAPAGIYLALQAGLPTARGWGIPMATDIAFVVGCMAVLGSRVPIGLRVMLLSLAIADDIGAVLVIAIGYTEQIQVPALAHGVGASAAIAGLERLGVRSLLVYTLLGVGVWLSFHESGVHATLAGVILGLQTPARAYLAEGRVAGALERASELFRGGGWSTLAGRAARVNALARAARETLSPVEYLEARLHPWVGFLIVPLFALANAGVPFSAAGLADPVAAAVAAGLVVGKPAGIVLASWVAVRLGVARLPEGVGWAAVAGAGCLAGIGFTMALFIAGLALDGAALDAAKVGILGGSAVSAVLGLALLVRVLPPAGSPRA
jgi:NhaA family Na+:H+ antiporter